MIHSDTIKLLTECNSGIKMGIDSIDEVSDRVQNRDFAKILSFTKDRLSELGSRTHELLNKYSDSTKEPNPIAKSMSWIKTNAALLLEQSDNTVADLMTEGGNMGVKSIRKYLNKYKAADGESREIAAELIKIQQWLVNEIGCYL